MHEHLSDAELALTAPDPDSHAAGRRQVIEQETAGCAICRTSLDFFSVVSADDLTEVEPWEPGVAWNGDPDPMAAYVDRIEAEDREADALLAERKLLSSPAKMAFTNVERDRRLLTGGVVRRLTAHAHQIYEDEPLDPPPPARRPSPAPRPR